LIQAPAHSGIRPAHCDGLGARSELVILVLEQDVERGERSVAARDILLQVELVGIAQFVAGVHLLLENSQIIPNHDDFVASTAVHRQEYAVDTAAATDLSPTHCIPPSLSTVIRLRALRRDR